MILIEVQDTLKQVPNENESKPMTRATYIAIAITTAFYMSIGCISYAGEERWSSSNYCAVLCGVEIDMMVVQTW